MYSIGGRGPGEGREDQWVQLDRGLPFNLILDVFHHLLCHCLRQCVLVNGCWFSVYSYLHKWDSCLEIAILIEIFWISLRVFIEIRVPTMSCVCHKCEMLRGAGVWCCDGPISEVLEHSMAPADRTTLIS